MHYGPCRKCNQLGHIEGEDCTECNGTGTAIIEEDDYSILEDPDQIDMFDEDDI